MLLGVDRGLRGPSVSRAWRPAASVARPRGGSLRTPAMQTLALVLLCVGVLFGAVEIGVAAASNALGATAAAGPLLGVWGVGSLAGGALAARAARRGTPAGRARAPRRRRPAAPRAPWPLRALARAAARCAAPRRCALSPAPLRGGSRLTALLLALTAAHLALVAAAGSVYALAAVLFLAGAAIAPTYATVFALVERAAPAGTVTEAFAWLATAVAVGSAVGAATAGAIAEHAGPAAVFAFAGVAGGARCLRPCRARLPWPRAGRPDRRGHDPLSRTAPRGPGLDRRSLPLRRTRRGGVRGGLAARRADDRRRPARAAAARPVRRSRAQRPDPADEPRRCAARSPRPRVRRMA